MSYAKVLIELALRERKWRFSFAFEHNENVGEKRAMPPAQMPHPNEILLISISVLL